MKKEDFELMKRGYDQGYNQGFGEAMRLAIKIITECRDERILPPHKVFLSADLKLQAKEILKKKGYLPYEYDVITGKAEPVNAPWEADE